MRRRRRGGQFQRLQHRGEERGIPDHPDLSRVFPIYPELSLLSVR